MVSNEEITEKTEYNDMSEQTEIIQNNESEVMTETQQYNTEYTEQTEMENTSNQETSEYNSMSENQSNNYEMKEASKSKLSSFYPNGDIDENQDEEDQEDESNKFNVVVTNESNYLNELTKTVEEDNLIPLALSENQFQKINEYLNREIDFYRSEKDLCELKSDSALSIIASEYAMMEYEQEINKKDLHEILKKNHFRNEIDTYFINYDFLKNKSVLKSCALQPKADFSWRTL